jgi:hypothetical protein
MDIKDSNEVSQGEPLESANLRTEIKKIPKKEGIFSLRFIPKNRPTSRADIPSEQESAARSEVEVRVTNDGLQLIRSIGLDQTFANMQDPKNWGGEEIGRGTESIVSRTELGGRMCVIKRPNVAASESIAEREAILSVSFSAANYEANLGNTTQIANILSSVKDHFSTFQLGDSPREYIAAGKNFGIEEYLAGDTVLDVMNFVRSDSSDDEMYQGFTKAHWREWYAAFDKEAERLEDIFFLLRYEQERNGHPFNIYKELDVHPGNFKIRSIDPSTGIPTLALMDQVDPSPIAQGGAAFDNQMMDSGTRYISQSQQYEHDPLLIALRGDDQTAQRLKEERIHQEQGRQERESRDMRLVVVRRLAALYKVGEQSNFDFHESPLRYPDESIYDLGDLLYHLDSDSEERENRIFQFLATLRPIPQEVSTLTGRSQLESLLGNQDVVRDLRLMDFMADRRVQNVCSILPDGAFGEFVQILIDGELP